MQIIHRYKKTEKSDRSLIEREGTCRDVAHNKANLALVSKLITSIASLPGSVTYMLRDTQSTAKPSGNLDRQKYLLFYYQKRTR